jgi:hypothetical protein
MFNVLRSTLQNQNPEKTVHRCGAKGDQGRDDSLFAVNIEL